MSPRSKNRGKDECSPRMKLILVYPLSYLHLIAVHLLDVLMLHTLCRSICHNREVNQLTCKPRENRPHIVERLQLRMRLIVTSMGSSKISMSHSAELISSNSIPFTTCRY